MGNVKLNISGDGTALGTRITDQQGKLVSNIKRIELVIDGEDMLGRCVVTFVGSESVSLDMNVNAEAKFEQPEPEPTLITDRFLGKSSEGASDQ